MFVVDTNVLLYATNPAAPEHEVCVAKVEEWRSSGRPWHVTWSVLYEFLRATTHRIYPRRLTAQESWSVIESLLASPALSVLSQTDRHAAVLAEAISELPTIEGNRVHDLHIAVLMREHGIRQIVTRDTGFHRFPWIEVVDPLVR